jgi:ABC-type branched-subunit amino acid transport system substrate-binding protein
LTLVALTAACTSDPDDPGTADGGGGGDAGPTTGLTDDTIKIGFIGVDFGSLAQAGLAPDLGDQELTMQAFVDDINADGGIAGRQIELHIEIYDPLAGEAVGQAACLAVTQDFGAFAVILASAVTPEVAECIAVTNQTLVVENIFSPDSLFEAAEGRVWELGVSQSRFLRSWAVDLDEQGLLDADVGILTNEGPRYQDAVETDLVPQLEELGHAPVATVVLPCADGDDDCDQHEAGIQQLKDAGAEIVLVNVAPLANGPVLDAAANLDFAPTWSYAGDAVTDTVAQFYEGSSDILDGAVGLLSFYGESEPSPVAEACADVASAAGADYDVDSDAYGFTTSNCSMLRLLRQAVESVDGDVGQTSVIEAFGAIGEFETTALDLPGTWSPDKHDAADFGQRMVFDASTHLWEPAEDEPLLFGG